jgi:hypothetical protein
MLAALLMATALPAASHEMPGIAHDHGVDGAVVLQVPEVEPTLVPTQPIEVTVNLQPSLETEYVGSEVLCIDDVEYLVAPDGSMALASDAPVPAQESVKQPDKAVPPAA